MTKEETIKVLQSIEDRAGDFPCMTACDWVAIATAKRHLENSISDKYKDSYEQGVIDTIDRTCDVLWNMFNKIYADSKFPTRTIKNFRKIMKGGE